jgi:hypothetical protein
MIASASALTPYICLERRRAFSNVVKPPGDSAELSPTKLLRKGRGSMTDCREVVA